MPKLKSYLATRRTITNSPYFKSDVQETFEYRELNINSEYFKDLPFCENLNDFCLPARVISTNHSRTKRYLNEQGTVHVNRDSGEVYFRKFTDFIHFRATQIRDVKFQRTKSSVTLHLRENKFIQFSFSTSEDYLAAIEEFESLLEYMDRDGRRQDVVTSLINAVNDVRNVFNSYADNGNPPPCVNLPDNGGEAPIARRPPGGRQTLHPRTSSANQSVPARKRPRTENH